MFIIKFIFYAITIVFLGYESKKSSQTRVDCRDK
jgi:hypothetical protein